VVLRQGRRHSLRMPTRVALIPCARPLNSDVRRPSVPQYVDCEAGKSEVCGRVAGVARLEPGFVHGQQTASIRSATGYASSARFTVDAHAAPHGHRDIATPKEGEPLSQGEYLTLSSFGESATTQWLGSSIGFVNGTSNFRWSGP